MHRVLLHSTFGAALLLLSTSAAQALGFGAGVMYSTLGQPLDFAARLASDADEAQTRECVAAEVRVGDARVAPEHVLATIENGGQAGERRIRVTTRSAIDEPVVTVDVTVGCSSRVSRRFVAFVDPPTQRLAHTEPTDFVPQRAASQVAPLLDIVNAANPPARGGTAQRVADAKSAGGAATRRGASARRLFGASVERRAVPAVRVAAPAAGRGESRARATVTALRPGPRLRLEAALPVVPAPTTAAATAAAQPANVADAAGTAPAAPAIGVDTSADTASAALAVERARIEGLETALARLRSDSQAQQQTLAALQARLREAEGERYANGLVYLLALGLVFFALLAAAFWALLRRRHKRSRWFEAPARQQQRPMVAPVPVEAEAPTPRVSQPPSGWNEGAHNILPVTAPVAIGGLEVTTVLAPQSHYARMAREEASANALPHSAGPTSSPIEDLLDLEQQAEFFAVLGQDDAAAALLTSHLRHHADGSPLPFLHLLEIYRRLGRRGAFERARVDHGAHFGDFAPEWDAALEAGPSLADHAQVVADLQALWTTPSEAMRMIESLLFRRGEGVAVFDLAGYRELLFLYSVARDLVGQAQAIESEVDLYLPIDDDSPTVPLPRDAGGHAVDLDVSGWPDMSDEPLVIRRSAGRRTG